MQLFYNPDIDETTESFAFDKEESRHIVKVLRMQSGDILFVTNGLGIIFQTEIVLAADNKCSVKIVSLEKSPTPKYRLHMAVSPTKMNERYEWFIEKATEIGVTEITPVICSRSERKSVKIERFDKIVLSAMKQSAQAYLPKINEPVAFKDFMKVSGSELKLIAHCEETGKKSLKSILKPETDIIMLIGPEGDFSQKEIQLAIENNYIPISLGNTRLRTETAAIVACQSIAFINE